MDWRIVALGPFAMWALYAVFASLATRAHGEKPTMLAEAAAMALVGISVLILGGTSDFVRVTRLSLTFALAMGFMSALGLLTQLYALRIAPRDMQGTVMMLGGMYPVLGAVLFDLMGRLHLEGGAPMSGRQWLGVATGTLTLWLVSSK